jgi:predicted Zn-dependent peptidase
LTAAPDVWEEASRLLLVALFRDPADPVVTERERQTIRAELIGRELNPADAAAREIDAGVFGADHPWGRPAVGFSTTVGDLEVAQVDAFLRGNFVPERTVVAVVGPVDAADARTHLLPFFRGSTRREPEVPPRSPTDSLLLREYDSVTTWVVASYRYPPATDVEALHLLAYIVGEALEPSATRRSIYSAEAEVIRRIDGGEIRIQVVVPPAEAQAWAERIRSSVEALAEGPLSAGAFAPRLRRHRGERLRALAAPEARARAAARDLLLGGSGTGPLVELESLTPERLHTAAASLGKPVLLFLGPNVVPEDDPEEPETAPSPSPETLSKPSPSTVTPEESPPGSPPARIHPSVPGS